MLEIIALHLAYLIVVSSLITLAWINKISLNYKEITTFFYYYAL